MNQRLCHDSAWWLVTAITGLVENLVRDEERKEVFEALLEIAKAGLERHEVASERQQQRLHPSEN